MTCNLTNVTTANQTSFWQTTRKLNDTANVNDEDMDETNDGDDDTYVETEDDKDMNPIKIKVNYEPIIIKKKNTKIILIF